MARIIQGNEATVTTVDSSQRSNLPAQHSSNSRITKPYKYMRSLVYWILWGGPAIIILRLLYEIMTYAMLKSTPTSMHVRVTTCGFTIIVLDGLFLTSPFDSLSDVNVRVYHTLLQVVGFICMAVGIGTIYGDKSGGHFESVHGITGIACISVLCFLIFSLVLLYTKTMKKLIHPRVIELWHFVLVATCVGLGVISLFRSYDFEWVPINILGFVFHCSLNFFSRDFYYVTKLFAEWLAATAIFYICRHIVLYILARVKNTGHWLIIGGNV